MSVQRFGRCSLRPSSGISFQTREPSCRNRDLPRNLKPNPLFDPQGYSALVPLVILSSSLFMSVQRFGRCSLRPSSGIAFQTWEPSCRNRDLPQNLKPNPLFDPQGYSALVPLVILSSYLFMCTTFRPMFPPAFFRYRFSNSGAFLS